MADFASVADIEALLQLPITTAVQIASANMALKDATAAIRNYCRQFLERVTDETITLDSVVGMRLFLPELPAVSITEVIEDGKTLVVDDDYKLGQYGILHRVGKMWPAGIQLVEVTYTHGYLVIPDDIVAVCTRAASRAYQAGLKAVDSAGVPGIASKTLGDFSVSFQSEGGGGTGEGVLGASAARLLLLSEKDILDTYRI
jgi:hypothetical protein